MLQPSKPPDRIIDSIDTEFDHVNKLYRAGCVVARWFASSKQAESDALHWLLDLSGWQASYTARQQNQYAYQLKRAVAFAYATNDPTWSDSIVHGLEALSDRVRDSDIADKIYVLRLIEIAVERRRSTLNVSAREVAGPAGIRSVDKAAAALLRMQRTLASGVLLSVTYDGIRDHARTWELNLDWDSAVVRMISMCPLGDKPHNRSSSAKTAVQPLQPSGCIQTGVGCTPETRFREFVCPAKPGTEYTISDISRQLDVTRPAAKKLLNDHMKLFSGFCKGDRIKRTPDKWFKGQSKYMPFEQGDDLALWLTSCCSGLTLREAAAELATELGISVAGARSRITRAGITRQGAVWVAKGSVGK